jgi:HlyD family secretion protein
VNNPFRAWSLRRWLMVGLIAFVVLLVVQAMRPKPVPVDVHQVARGPLRVTIDEEGETRVRDRYVVSAPLAARLLRIELEPGDVVRAGQTSLATLKPVDPGLLDARTAAEAQARMRGASSSLSAAKAAVEQAASEQKFAELDHARVQRLNAESILSKDQLDAAELRLSTRREALRAAEFAARTAQHELEAARAAAAPRPAGDGQNIEIVAPIDGVVLRRLHESEAVVPAGSALLEIGAPDQLEIVSDLLSTDAVKARPGGRVLIESWGGEGALEGRIRRVEPSGFTKISALGVEEQRVNIVIDLASDRQLWSGLGDGYRVEVRVVVWESEDVLKAPNSALFRNGDDWAVFVLQDGKAVRRNVKLGQRNGLEAEILEGLAAGDQVIVHPSDQIADGVPVEIRKI